MLPESAHPDDWWTEEDEWRKLAEEVGAIPTASKATRPENGSADTPQMTAVASGAEPSVRQGDTTEHHMTTAEPLAATRTDEENGGGAGPAPVEELETSEAEGTLVGETESEHTDSEAEEEVGAGRRRRRRRRRRRNKGGNHAGGESVEENGGDAAVSSQEEIADSLAEQATSEAGAQEGEQSHSHWQDSTDPDQAAEVLREILAHWNVPSWDEIVAGLHRPER